jgi:hypothetical protein
VAPWSSSSSRRRPRANGASPSPSPHRALTQQRLPVAGSQRPHRSRELGEPLTPLDHQRGVDTVARRQPLGDRQLLAITSGTVTVIEPQRVRQHPMLRAPSMQLRTPHAVADTRARHLRERALARVMCTTRAETLEQLGGAAQVVRAHLDRALDALPPEQQRIAADASRYLITPSGSKIAQAPGDLAYWIDAPVEDVRAVLDALTAADVRILRLRDDHAYEIFSDVLAPAVLDWRARFESARERELLAERLVQETRASPEASVARLRRQLRLALAVIVLLATALVVVLVAG